MKKQLLAAAVAATFAAGASAAQVELYGGMDGGLLFTNAKVEYAKDYTGTVTKNKSKVLALENGITSASKWGMRGSEDLGNGYSVSFNLESGFAMDTGVAAAAYFNRDCRLTIATPYGEFSFGRMGSLSSSAGRYDLIAANATVYDGGWSAAMAYTDLFYNDFGRMDNAITYVTPTVNGFTGYFQYSNQCDSSVGTEGKSDTGRYFGAGLSFVNGSLTVVASAELNRDADENNKTLLQDKDTKCVSLGGNYVFPNGTTVYVATQYGNNVLGWSAYSGDNSKSVFSGSGTKFLGANGYNFVVGAAVPCFGGSVKGSVNYSNLKEKTAQESMSKSKFNHFGVALSYEYAFSKRTTAFAGAGYYKASFKNEGRKFGQVETMQATAGLRHAF